jgi:hypothetical protein
MGLASFLVLGALQGCSEEDDPAPGGAAGNSTAGSGGSAGAAGSGGSAGAAAGSGGSAGSGSEDVYCGTKESELPPLTSCDDPNASDCAKAMCAAVSAEKDCKQILTDCVADSGCNKSVACGGVCRAADPTVDVVATCTPLAGGGLAKALGYKGCADKLTACGGDGSLDAKLSAGARLGCRYSSRASPPSRACRRPPSRAPGAEPRERRSGPRGSPGRSSAPGGAPRRLPRRRR